MHLKINVKGKINNIKIIVEVLINSIGKLIGVEDKYKKYIEDTNNVIHKIYLIVINIYISMSISTSLPIHLALKQKRIYFHHKHLRLTLRS